MNVTFQHKLKAGFIFILLLALIIFLQGFVHADKLRQTAHWINHTNEVLFVSELVMKNVVTLESNQREYAISKNDATLKEHQKIRDSILKSLVQLAFLTQDNAARVQDIKILENLVARKIAFADKVIFLATNNTSIAALQLIATGTGRNLRMQVQERIKLLQADERVLFEQRKKNHDDEIKYFRNLLVLFAIAIILIFSVIAWLVFTNLRLRLQTEATLQKSLKEVSDYKYALDESAIVAITDQKGVIRHVNKNFCSISKYTSDELIGKDHRIINSGYHSKEFIKGLWATIANGKTWKGELKNKAKDGSTYWVETTIIPFLNEEGKPYQYIAIRSNITQRKEAEANLNQLNAELEERVAKRTVQLETVNKELEAFSYSVSHDLRSPLRAVNGYAKMLEEDYNAVFDEGGKRLLTRIQANADKMGRLIDDLLAFSRLGRKQIRKTETDMTALFKEVCTEIEKSSHNAAIEINELHPAKADYSLIYQVVVNLLSNAVKYSSKKEKPVIKINSRKENKEVIYSVADNGAGFDMAYANKLFGVFQRLHSDAEFSGTGVGLAIVELVIKKHEGRIWAEATPGEGATFYFSLPE